MDERTDEIVVVVGAGLVGSLTAIYLAKAKFTVKVYEKRPDIRSMERVEGRSINLALSERGLHALRLVDLEKKVLSEMAMPMKARMVHSSDKSGRVKVERIPYGEFDEGINSVSRRELNELLLDEMANYKNISLHFEQEVEHIDADNNMATFRGRNGRFEEVNFSFMLGCDGAYSVCRRELMKLIRMDFHQDYIFHGYKELYIPATLNGGWSIEPDCLHIWPKKQFMLIALPNKDGSFTVTLFLQHSRFAELNNEASIVEFFKRNFPDFVSLFEGNSIIIKDFQNNPVGSLVTMRCSQYHYKDKIVLLGDAAHAMVPFYGQGMNAGFEDVRIFSEMLARVNGDGKTREEIFQEYSQKRHPDAQAICDLALYNYWEMSTAVMSPLFRLKQSIFSLLHRLFPRHVLPLYTMVAFTNIPYSSVVARHHKQDFLLNSALSTFGALGVSLCGYAAYRFYTS